jgi:uncharacterized protein YcbK (DUF882 family)
LRPKRWSFFRPALLPWLGALSVFSAVAVPSYTETAIANGDTRTIHLYHAHTHETIDATYRVNGEYDPTVLKQLNWFLRDWRRDEPTSMDPRLFDVVWEVYRSAGVGSAPVTVMSAYRSPETNAMLRRRSRAVAEHSQHMLGKAMDTSMPGMAMEQIREIGMKFQRGGVGYYPTAGTPFVHLDVGGVRSWPRMSYDQLVRLFPDGKTVHLPTNGQPLARYEEARAEIAAGGAVAPPSSRSSNFFAWLFGGGNSAADDEDSAEQAPARTQVAAVRGGRNSRGNVQMASLMPRGGSAATTSSGDDSGRDFAIAQANRGQAYRNEVQPAVAPEPASTQTSAASQVAQAESNLPRGETYMQPASAAPGRTQVAALAPPVASLAASLAASDAAPAAVDEAEPAASIVPNLPLPPRRPADLFALANIPLPPARPIEIAALGKTPALPAATTAYTDADIGLRRDPIAGLIDNSATAAIRNLDRNVPKQARPAAATASLAPVTGLRAAPARLAAPAQAHVAAPVVPARLDRSNFAAMTGQASATRMTTQSVRGPALVATRSAARAADNAMLGAPSMGSASSFGTIATDLPTETFAPTRQKRASR